MLSKWKLQYYFEGNLGGAFLIGEGYGNRVDALGFRLALRGRSRSTRLALRESTWGVHPAKGPRYCITFRRSEITSYVLVPP